MLHRPRINRKAALLVPQVLVTRATRAARVKTLSACGPLKHGAISPFLLAARLNFIEIAVIWGRTLQHDDCPGG